MQGVRITTSSQKFKNLFSQQLYSQTKVPNRGYFRLKHLPSQLTHISSRPFRARRGFWRSEVLSVENWGRWRARCKWGEMPPLLHISRLLPGKIIISKCFKSANTSHAARHIRRFVVYSAAYLAIARIALCTTFSITILVLFHFLGGLGLVNYKSHSIWRGQNFFRLRESAFPCPYSVTGLSKPSLVQRG